MKRTGAILLGIYYGIFAVWWAYGRLTFVPTFPIQSLGNFDFHQINGAIAQLPESIRKLDGKRVSIVGELCPLDVSSKTISSTNPAYVTFITSHRAPLIQNFVTIRPGQGAQLSFLTGLVKVTGTFHIGIERSEGRVSEVYRMDLVDLRQMPSPPIASPGFPSHLLVWPVSIYLVLLTVFQLRKWRQPVKGMCRVCGYDLRASKDRCPECGSPIASTNKTPSPASDSQ